MYYDPDNDPGVGCIAWIIVILIAVAISWSLIHAMMTDDPPGRCDREPGPNGITITTCERN